MVEYQNGEVLMRRLVDLALEKKAKDVVSLKLTGLTLIADYFIILSATNTRQAQAIADALYETLKDENQQALRIEGYQDGRWILLDFGSVVVHIFQPDERSFYDLETLWGDAEKQTYEA